MTQNADLRCLAAIICVYSLYEFLLRRIFKLPGGESFWRYVIYNSAILLMFLSICTAGFISWGLFWDYVVVSVVKAVIDFSLRKSNSNYFLEYFIAIEFVAFALLIACWSFQLPIQFNNWYMEIETSLVQSIGVIGVYLQQHATMIFLVLSVYFFVVDGGAKVVRGILYKFPVLMETISKQPTNSENRGEWIGILERIITLTFVLTGNYTAVAFALTAKSIARFKELEDKDFAEYYLLGTFSSLALALLTGAILHYLLNNL